MMRRGPARVPEAERAVQARGQQHLVGHVERHVGEQHRGQGDDHAAVAELRAGLNHRGQAEDRALGGVEGHEEGSGTDAEDAARSRRFGRLRPGYG
jgi:hypothetical protein